MNKTERLELRLTPEEKEVIQLASEKKGMTVSEFIRHMAVEMAEAIATNKSTKDTFYALLMGVGKVSPELVLYSATADMSEYTSLTEKGESEIET